MFTFPPTHSWGYWGSQLQAMKPDMQRVLGRNAHRLIHLDDPAVANAAPGLVVSTCLFGRYHDRVGPWEDGRHMPAGHPAHDIGR